MEDNLNTNNEINGGKTNNNNIIIIVLTILLVGALGFICYDKFINTEKPPVPTPVPTPSVNPTPTGTDNLEIIEIKEGDFKEIQLTESNKIINIGNKSFNIRIEKMGDSDVAGPLYIDDVAITDKDDLNVHAAYAYVTNDFIFFIGYGQSFYVENETYQEYITYAIDSNGDKINLSEHQYQLRDIHLESDEIVATGVNALDALEDKATPTKLVIKFENNTITVMPKN